MSKPMLRFEGFTDDWEKRKLGDLVALVSSPLRSMDLQDIGEYPVYNANDLIGYHDTYLSDTEYISIIKDGAGVGRMRALDPYTNITGTMNGLVPKEGVYLNYVAYVLNNINFDKYVVGTTIPHIYYKDYKQENLQTPTLPEQELIGNSFKTIDDLILAQEQAVKAYGLYKEAMLQKMFPKKGQVNPDLRFEGFNDDWEKKVLSDFITLKNGYSFKSGDYNDSGEYSILTISNVQGDRYVDMTTSNKIINIPYDIQDHQILSPGDILISMTGNVGRTSIVDVDNALLNQRVGILEHMATGSDNRFIFYVVNNPSFEASMMAKGQGAAQLNIGKGDIENYIFSIPSLEEQTLIGNFFKTLDETIEGHQVKLDQYKEMKESFLQKMFI